MAERGEDMNQGSGLQAPCQMVIEDDADWRGLVARVLSSRSRGTEVLTAETLEAGLKLLKSRDVELVFLDLNLPDSHGLETLRSIRNVTNGALVVMTGETDEATALQALREGAQDYLVKGKLDVEALTRTARYARERMATEQRLRDSEQLLVSTLDALPACIAILDETGTILAVNDRWNRYDNPGNPFIFGCRVDCSYTKVLDLVMEAPGDLSQVAMGISEVVFGQRASFNEDCTVKSLHGLAWYEVRANQFRVRNSHVVISFMDVSERKKLEARLLISEELLSIISENAVDLLAIVNDSGRRLYTSSSYQKILGYSEEEMAMMEGTDLLHPQDKPSVDVAMARLFTEGSVQGLEYRLAHKQGGYRTFESNATLILNMPGRAPQALVVARDVTERQEAERERTQIEMQLRQAQKLEAIGQLAAGIAHEINTPTQYIGDNTIFLRDSFNEIGELFEWMMTVLETSEDTSLDPVALRRRLSNLDLPYLVQEIPKAIHQSLEGVSRVTKIVSAMKDFSHLGGDLREFIDLNRAIESTLTVSRNEWKYVAELELDLDPTLPPVPCFPSEFNQVILNLVVNAAHSIEARMRETGSESKGLIRLRTRRVDQTVELQVQDTGTGIPESIRSRIFDPFFTTKPVGKGTGQGLSIVHHVIVDRHHGRIGLETEAGRGTTFSLFLPLHHQTEELES